MVSIAQGQFGGNMRQLGLLRLGERFHAVIPIGAAILHVLAIQHQLVERIADIIMMRDIALRAQLVVDRLPRKGDAVAQAPQRAWRTDASAAIPWGVRTQQLDQFHDATLLQRQAAIHKGFRRAEPRIQHNIARNLGVRKCQGNVEKSFGRLAKGLLRAVCKGDGKRALFDDGREVAADEGFAHGGYLWIAAALRHRFLPLRNIDREI